MPTVKQDDDDEVEADFGMSSARFARHPVPTGAKSMLVVDRQVDPEGLLATAALASVVVVDFDSRIDSTDVCVSKIEQAYAANGGTKLATVAFANHGGRVWQLATDCICHPNHDDEEYVIAAAPVLSALAQCTTEGGRIDLLGCRLLRMDERLPDKLEKMFKGIHFTASDDDTGNPRAGGDWIMESDGLDISADYFDLMRLKVYNDTMWGWFDWMDAIPFVGSVVRAGQFVVAAVQGDTEGMKDAGSNLAMNVVGDLLTVVTGPGGKAVMAGARAGAKVGLQAGAKAIMKSGVKLATRQGAKIFVKAGVKEAGPLFLRTARQNMTKAFSWRNIQKMGIKQLYATPRETVKAFWELALKEGKLPDELDGIVNALHHATGIDINELDNMSPAAFLGLFGAVGSVTSQDVNEFNTDMAMEAGHVANNFIAIGCNSAGQIFYRRGVGGCWLQLDGLLKQVAISGCGKHIIGCNSAGQNFYRAGLFSYWQQLDGGLKQVSISSCGEHFLGCNSAGQIYYRAGVGGLCWQPVDGGLKQVSISSGGKHFLGCNSAGQNYYRAGLSGSWQQLDGFLQHVAIGHVTKSTRDSFPNVRASTGDNSPRLWGVVKMPLGVSGVPILTLELTWHDQGWGHRKGFIYARKDGGAWVGISTDAAEHEPTRESFEIPAELALGGKLELGYSVGHGGHSLTITNAAVEITY